MTDLDDIIVVPATADRWDDVAALFGTRGDPSRCWCQWFRMRNSEWRNSNTAANRAAFRTQFDEVGAGSAPPPGVLAYLAGEPAGWCAVAPRAGYDRLLASPMLRTLEKQLGADDPGDPTVWSVTCFVVRVGNRRRGVAGALLRGALDLARQRGARVVEAYPVDVDAKANVSSSELYRGSLSMFTSAGFAEVARSGQTRPVVRLELNE